MRPALCLLFLPVAAVAAYACDDHDEGAAGLEDVAFEGGATDEALLALLAKLDSGPPISDPAQAPTLTAPQSTTLSASTNPTFSWQIGEATSAIEGRAERLATSWPLDTVRHATGWSAGGWLTGGWLMGGWLMGGVGEAHAHGAPYTGYATLLVISNADSEALMRAFTSELSFTTHIDAWATVANADQPVTLTLTGALFDNNRVIEGPYEGTSVQLDVEP